MHFTAETEVNNALNCLDISIHRTPKCLRTSFYRKPTFTDTIIPYTSNHPTQHKNAAIKFLYNRLNSYDLCFRQPTRCSSKQPMIVETDKGKTCVTIYANDYFEEVHNNYNNFQKLQKDPTDKYKKYQTLQQCDLIFHKTQTEYLIQKQAQTPSLKAQIKIHKLGKPIRPVNNTNAPTYKISTFLVKNYMIT